MKSISDRIMLDPLIRTEDADYTTSFNSYYGNAMAAFDEFYKKYNMVLLRGNGIYERFPDGTTNILDFFDMEHAIGISSFGVHDTIANDFMNELLNNISITIPSRKTLQEFLKKRSDIERIINLYRSTGIISNADYTFINELFIEFKDVDNKSIQEALFELSKIILEYSYNNKGNLIKYNPTIYERKEEMINDLVYFIDNMKDAKIKSILFNNEDFSNLHAQEGSKDNFDEKSLVLGVFTSYINDKYDINANEKRGLGINVGEMINEAKNKYFSFYARKTIMDKMNKSQNTIKKKLKDFLTNPNEEQKEQLNKIINSIINNKTIKITLDKNNINNYIELSNRKDINIDTMILLNNASKDIPILIEKNEQEIEKAKKQLDKLKEKKEQLEEIIKTTYYSNLSDAEYKNLIKSIIRNKKSNSSNSKQEELENYLIEISRKYKNKYKKYESLLEFSYNLLTLKENTNNIEKNIRTSLVTKLKDYSEGKISKVQQEKDDYLNNMVCDIFENNYVLQIKREAKVRFNYPPDPNKQPKTEFLPNIGSPSNTNSLKLKTGNNIRELSCIFNGLNGYDPNDTDYENALKLFSEISDRYSLNIAYNLYSRGQSTADIVRYFRQHTNGVGLIHLVHSLMKNNGVKTFLKRRASIPSAYSFNFDKIMYKCNSMLSIDEIINSRVKVIKTADAFSLKDLTLTPQEERDIRQIINRCNCPYILLLGGNSGTKTLVYLSRKQYQIGRGLYQERLVPIHSLRYETDGKFKELFTKEEILNDRFLPQRRKRQITSGIELSTSEPRVIRAR